MGQIGVTAPGPCTSGVPCRQSLATLRPPCRLICPGPRAPLGTALDTGSRELLPVLACPAQLPQGVEVIWVEGKFPWNSPKGNVPLKSLAFSATCCCSPSHLCSHARVERKAGGKQGRNISSHGSSTQPFLLPHCCSVLGCLPPRLGLSALQT